MNKLRRNHKLKGSMTVEMSLLMPVILFLIMGCILAAFYYHDKNVLSGAAYETAVVGSTKMHRKKGLGAEELETLFNQRVKGKCILFTGPAVTVSVKEDEIEITVMAERNGMKLSIVKRAAVTEPEKHIRDWRRLN